MSEFGACITLLTDFGTLEPFVGMMKGVILGIHPEARIVDLTHEVPPHDVAAASYHLSNAWSHFPPGSIHVAVVDPGVGSSRRALALTAGGHTFLAPDNGILTPLLALPWRAYEIVIGVPPSNRMSATFHGRDIFAPVAAHLARGSGIESLGPPLACPVRLPIEEPLVSDGAVRARVVHVDRFGNVILDVREADLARACGRAGGFEIAAEIGGRSIDTFVTHYAAAQGRPCFLIDSNGRLEIAVPERSASALFGLERGAPIVLRVK